MAKLAAKKKGANGYKLPDPLPKGEILIDIAKNKWKLGTSIGQGGFGEIYMAQQADSKGTNYPYVVKIEPHENGPLFVEINFYIRNAKSQDVDDFKNKQKLQTFGMPIYIGSGSHEHKNEKYRFLVMPRYGTDIWKLFLENGKTLPSSTVFKLGVHILDVLEYIHERGYVHADIKGANVLLGSTKENKDQSFLVDFGLATKYQVGKEFKPNPKKAHDGTIEYLSRDAHQGVPTRRGDMEILAYNLIQWLGCKLPWETDLSKPELVQANKEKHMSDVATFLKTCFSSKKIPVALSELLKYINTLSFDGKPDYVKIRKMFVSEIESHNDKLSSPLIFKNMKETSSPTKRKSGQKTPISKKLKTETVKDTENIVDVKEIKAKDKILKTKLTKRVLKEDQFEGYTPEMKAVALKKLQNGKKQQVKKPMVVDKNNESPVENKNGELNIRRARRNLKQVNYNESAL